ncbi:hypothetical protein P154DRAFT_620096 [Amniculicola lignicola CBS 123094]|uniref:Uncharacterized protein n=1 Tax=Amniculicola lignicola CBS 123094 TaxID=1392246 RepID=A0A6A5WSP0_9PLEO|nr:hypothetical protein P154DRAFT_620096 [Amniculicola lignicola CBS 123094]
MSLKGLQIPVLRLAGACPAQCGFRSLRSFSRLIEFSSRGCMLLGANYDLWQEAVEGLQRCDGESTDFRGSPDDPTHGLI